MAHDPEIEAVLNEILRLLEPPAPELAVDRLAELARLVEEWGGRMNLSGHRSAQAICESLIADAVGMLIELERAIGAPVARRVIDLGSGAGFPGLPIAILRPGAEIYLVEIRERRHFFQRAACRTLGLKNAHPVRARIEDHATGPGHIVMAQAVGPIAEVVEAMRAYLSPGSWAVVPGGAELESPAAAADLEPIVVDYRSPILDQPRRLWIGRAKAR